MGSFKKFYKHIADFFKKILAVTKNTLDVSPASPPSFVVGVVENIRHEVLALRYTRVTIFSVYSDNDGKNYKLMVFGHEFGYDLEGKHIEASVSKDIVITPYGTDYYYGISQYKILA